MMGGLTELIYVKHYIFGTYKHYLNFFYLFIGDIPFIGDLGFIYVPWRVPPHFFNLGVSFLLLQTFSSSPLLKTTPLALMEASFGQNTNHSLYLLCPDLDL